MSRRRGGVSIGRSYRRYHGIGGAIYRSETETKVSWRFAPLRHILTARLSPHERASKSLTTVFRARDYRPIRESAYASVDGGSDMEASLASLVDELSRLRDQLEKEGAKLKRAEAALLESDRESRLIMELRQAYGRLAEAQQLSKTGSFVTDLAANRNWSDEAYRIFDFDPAIEVTVQMVREVVHPDDRPS